MTLTYEYEILEIFQKELGGKIADYDNAGFSLESDYNNNPHNLAPGWCVELKTNDIDEEDDGIYRLWAWASQFPDTVQFPDTILTVALADPNSFQKVVNHIKEVKHGKN